MAQRVLVVDDEANVTDVVQRYLNSEGYEVAIARDGMECLRLFREWQPDLLVLDLMLPVVDGLEVCRRLRQDTELPIIMLTARSGEADRVVGLEMGADDYLVKPFSPRELVARVKAVLRRAAPRTIRDKAGSLRFRGIVIDPQARSVSVEEKDIQLTAREFDLLLHLANHRGQVLSRCQIMQEVWDHSYAGHASTVTVHIRRLREKIEANPMRPRFIKTVWGVGYKFDP